MPPLEKEAHGLPSPGQRKLLQEDDRQFISVPPHVVADPVVSYSVLPDARPVLAVAVSYYFEGDQAAQLPWPADVGDPGQYMSGGVLLLDINARRWLWRTPLDLSTDHDDAQAIVYSSPTIAGWIVASWMVHGCPVHHTPPLCLFCCV